MERLAEAVSWKRLSGGREIDPDFYVEEGEDAKYEPGGLSERAYGWKGHMWPRVSIHVYEGWDHMKGPVALKEPSLKLSCAYKSQQGQWWDTLDGVPLSLIEEAEDMIREAKTLVASKREGR